MDCFSPSQLRKKVRFGFFPPYIVPKENKLKVKRVCDVNINLEPPSKKAFTCQSEKQSEVPLIPKFV